MSKKIVILGGGKNQLPLIQKAKYSGYYVVLCDFRDNVPGIPLSDIHYQINTMDFDAVLSVCLKEKPDGIITNSEPVMPILTKVSSELGLPGNSIEGIKTLMSKADFRKLQKKLGLYCPQSIIVDSLDELKKLKSWIFPLIIKPCECSGSRGSRKISHFDEEQIQSSFIECKSYSRNGKVVIEEFVDMPSLTTIEGDIFLYKDEILWAGLFYTKRSPWAPMVPQTYIAPLQETDEWLGKIKESLIKIFKAANIVFGEYNIEGYFTNSGEFFIIEINVRQGGHEIPLFIEDFSNIDLSRLLVSTCVSDDSYWNNIKNYAANYNYVVKHTVFSRYSGIYHGLFISDEVKKYVKRLVELKNIGDKVDECVNGTNLVAIVDLFFDNALDQQRITSNIFDYIHVILADESI